MIRLTDRAVARPLDDKVVILDTESGSYYELDRVGARIWQLLAKSGDLDDIVTSLVLEFAVEADDARRDLTAFLEALAEHGLIEDV